MVSNKTKILIMDDDDLDTNNLYQILRDDDFHVDAFYRSY